MFQLRIPTPPPPEQRGSQEHKNAYCRELGWREYDSDGDSIPVTIMVVDASIGFNIFRFGQDVMHLGWTIMKEDAIDWASEYCKKEISAHELRQAERDS